jgi:hypothetical protein
VLPETWLLNTDNVITTTIAGEERGADKKPASLDAWFETQFAVDKQERVAYQLREGSQKQFAVDGQPAESYVADFTDEGKPASRYIVNVLTDSWAISFKTRCDADQLEDYRKQLDQAIAELKWKP